MTPTKAAHGVYALASTIIVVVMIVFTLLSLVVVMITNNVISADLMFFFDSLSAWLLQQMHLGLSLVWEASLEKRGKDNSDLSSVCEKCELKKCEIRCPAWQPCWCCTDHVNQYQ